LAGDAGIGPARRALALDHAPHLLAFHCWPDGQGGAEGVCIDDAGDGDGPARRDALRVEGACSGGSATWTWDRSGDFSSPDLVRVVLHGLTAQRAVADGTEVPVSGSVVVVDCPPFSELTLEGLRPTHPLGV